MANITITIADAQLARVVNAVAETHGWTQASGVTKPAFAKQVLIDILRGILQSSEGEQAATTARQAAETKARTEVVIT